MDRQTVYAAMKVYQHTHREYAQLKKRFDLLVLEQTTVLDALRVAEAADNKAREAMLQAVQTNDAAKA